MSESIFFAAFFFPSAAAVLIFGMKYIAAIKQAKVRKDQDDAYRELAARSASAQAETAAALSGVRATLADVQSRLAGLEKVLKEVE